jgi:hypothetical protein
MGAREKEMDKGTKEEGGRREGSSLVSSLLAV